MEVKYARLSPPWWTLFNKIANTIGKDPGVNVSNMYQKEEDYYIDIQVQSLTKAQSLAAILVPHYALGNIQVYVRVLDENGNVVQGQLPVGVEPVKSVMEAVETALGSNELFEEVIDARGKLPPTVVQMLGQVVVVLDDEVVQFWNDDLSDFYGNFNGVASDVFAEVLQREYPGDVFLTTTTENEQNDS